MRFPGDPEPDLDLDLDLDRDLDRPCPCPCPSSRVRVRLRIQVRVRVRMRVRIRLLNHLPGRGRGRGKGKARERLSVPADPVYTPRPMLYVACSGFPVPVSRYWSLFPAVEISDTELGIPGAGTIRRWLRESPKGFAFTALAPKELGESGFRKTKENKALVEAFGKFCKDLGSQAAVFQAPEDFTPSKSTKSAIKSFVGWLPDDLPRVVLDLPGWKPADVVKACGKRPVTAAYDPLQEEPPPGDEFVYARLPGPAGHRSRYDEDAMEEITAHCAELKENAELAFCVFRNIDMQANGTGVLDKLG